MKIYLSVDMEGIAGIASWPEATPGDPDYLQFRRLMTREVVAACEGARAAGAEQVWIKDAHWTGRNILLEDLPDYAAIIRDWSGSPMGAFQELDKSFAAIVLIGWHDRAGSEASPLAHTIMSRVAEIRINGRPVSEFGIYAYLAEYCGVPIALLSGDTGVCAEVKAYNDAIVTVPALTGIGASTVSISPTAIRAQIRHGVERALAGNLARYRRSLPQAFDIEVTYGTPTHAYKFSWYPGARHIGRRTIKFAATDYFEVKRFLQFVTQ